MDIRHENLYLCSALASALTKVCFSKGFLEAIAGRLLTRGFCSVSPHFRLSLAKNVAGTSHGYKGFFPEPGSTTMTGRN